MAILHASATNFDSEVLQCSQTVLVDFYADWCGPCKMLTPVIEEIAAEHPEVKVVKLNVDNAPEIASRYGVMSIPTLIVFKNGQAANQSVGYTGKQGIVDML
ncbi:MAG: thioredoxin [Clostridiales bacterium]|nr:thioredoxin [Clostridiales bacterium]